MIGLDISSSSVKLGRVCPNLLPVRWFWSVWRASPSRRAGSSTARSKSFDEVADAVRRVVSRSGTKTRHVVMAYAAVGRHHQEDRADPPGCAKTRWSCRSSQRPTSTSRSRSTRSSLDFCVIGPNANSVGDVDVLIAASRKDRVQDRQGLS